MSYLGQAIDYSFVPTASTALGPDRERRAYAPDARYWDATATWAQRAVNAFRASRGQAPIAVDGRAGPLTIAGLAAAGPGLPAPSTFPENVAVTPRVLISKTLATRLEALQRVADPAPVPRPHVLEPAPTDPATPGEPKPAEVEVSRRSLLPWILGGTALVGLGAYFMFAGTPVRANRRRRRRS